MPINPDSRYKMEINVLKIVVDRCDRVAKFAISNVITWVYILTGCGILEFIASIVATIVMAFIHPSYILALAPAYMTAIIVIVYGFILYRRVSSQDADFVRINNEAHQMVYGETYAVKEVNLESVSNLVREMSEYVGHFQTYQDRIQFLITPCEVSAVITITSIVSAFLLLLV